MQTAALAYLKTNRAGPVTIGDARVTSQDSKITVEVSGGPLQARRTFEIPHGFDRFRSPASTLKMIESLVLDINKQTISYQSERQRLRVVEDRTPGGRIRASAKLWEGTSRSAKPVDLIFEASKQFAGRSWENGSATYRWTIDERNLTGGKSFTRERASHRGDILRLTGLEAAADHIRDIQGDLGHLR